MARVLAWANAKSVQENESGGGRARYDVDTFTLTCCGRSHTEDTYKPYPDEASSFPSREKFYDSTTAVTKNLILK